MSALNAAEMNRIATQHADLFKRSLWKRYRGPIILAAILLYLVFAWWFFAIGKVLSTASWAIAGNYLADWVSYEVRPEVSIAPDGYMTIGYSRFDPIGPNPDPDWIEAKTMRVRRQIESPAAPVAAPAPAASGFNFLGAAPQPQQQAAPQAQTREEDVVTEAIVHLGSGATLDIAADRVLARRGAEEAVLRLDAQGDRVAVKGGRPDWIDQREEGGRAIVYFGLSGWAEVASNRIRIHNRFLGWPNFFFAPESRFFGKSPADLAKLVVSGERLDPARSNLSLALDDFFYNPNWQHLDVWSKLLQTLVMAFLGMVFASLLSLPLAFLAARNITPSRLLNQTTKRFFDFLRSVDMLIWALFLTRAFGPGPLAGSGAIFLTETGTLGKLYAEGLENIDNKPREGVRSTGGASLLVQRYGVMPQVVPVLVSQTLYQWESNVRSATIIGAVGAGGIGLKLWEAMRTNANWCNVAYMVLLILIVVFLFDSASAALRQRLIGRQAPG